jgi:hypothetical protein
VERTNACGQEREFSVGLIAGMCFADSGHYVTCVPYKRLSLKKAP